MRFWDASAIVPLCISEGGASQVDGLFHYDTELAVWWSTHVECASAIARSRRAGRIQATDEAAASDVLADLAMGWYEIEAGPAVRAHALRLLRVHALRAADALQLAAATVWAGFPAVGEIVTLDHRLAEAARLEGFTVLP